MLSEYANRISSCIRRCWGHATLFSILMLQSMARPQHQRIQVLIQFAYSRQIAAVNVHFYSASSRLRFQASLFLFRYAASCIRHLSQCPLMLLPLTATNLQISLVRIPNKNVFLTQLSWKPHIWHLLKFSHSLVPSFTSAKIIARSTPSRERRTFFILMGIDQQTKVFFPNCLYINMTRFIYTSLLLRQYHHVRLGFWHRFSSLRRLQFSFRLCIPLGSKTDGYSIITALIDAKGPNQYISLYHDPG